MHHSFTLSAFLCVTITKNYKTNKNETFVWQNYLEILFFMVHFISVVPSYNQLLFYNLYSFFFTNSKGGVFCHLLL